MLLTCRITSDVRNVFLAEVTTMTSQRLCHFSLQILPCSAATTSLHVIDERQFQRIRRNVRQVEELVRCVRAVRQRTRRRRGDNDVQQLPAGRLLLVWFQSLFECRCIRRQMSDARCSVRLHAVDQR